MIVTLLRWILQRPGLLPVFFILASPVVAGQPLFPGARSLSLGGCYSMLTPDGGMLQNESLLSQTRKLTMSATHQRPFAVKELGVTILAIQLPVETGAFSFTAGNYGIPGFQQFRSALGFGMLLSEKLSAGIGFSYTNSLTSGEWNYLWQIGISGGATYLATQKTTLTLHLVNPVTINSYPSPGALPSTIIVFGIAQEIYPDTHLFAGIQHFSDSGNRCCVGLEYTLSEAVSLRTGYHTHPHSFTFGTEFNFGRYRIELGCSSSAMVGITPAIQLSYR